ncbi:MAG: ATP-binding protein [Nitrospirales bacterium]
MTNARDAVDSSSRKSISLSSVEQGDMVKIVFHDSGMGMSAEHQGRIFDPFFTTKPVGEGTGLGLSISYGIITEHQGQISVESHPGDGATFTIQLPLLNVVSEDPTELDLFTQRNRWGSIRNEAQSILGHLRHRLPVPRLSNPPVHLSFRLLSSLE